jgi:hypothetical protein
MLPLSLPFPKKSPDIAPIANILDPENGLSEAQLERAYLLGISPERIQQF